MKKLLLKILLLSGYTGSGYTKFLSECIETIVQNRDEFQFGIDTLAMESGMSHSLLYKKIKMTLGRPVNEQVRLVDESI